MQFELCKILSHLVSQTAMTHIITNYQVVGFVEYCYNLATIDDKISSKMVEGVLWLFKQNAQRFQKRDKFSSTALQK